MGKVGRSSSIDQVAHTPADYISVQCAAAGQPNGTTGLAQAMQRSRFAISRWLRGQTEPKLPEFLALVEHSTLRLLDFLAGLAEVSERPDLQPGSESPFGPKIANLHRLTC